MKHRNWLLAAAALQSLTLTACVPATMVPTVAVQPGRGKTPVDFSNDNTVCSAQANQQVAAARNAANGQIVSAMLLTDPDTTSATAQYSIASVQQQFDTAYSACMYARGEFVPGYVVEDEPIPTRRRRVTKPAAKPASSTSAGTGFVEPAPSATPASGQGFAEPAPSH